MIRASLLLIVEDAFVSSVNDESQELLQAKQILSISDNNSVQDTKGEWGSFRRRQSGHAVDGWTEWATNNFEGTKIEIICSAGVHSMAFQEQSNYGLIDAEMTCDDGSLMKSTNNGAGIQNKELMCSNGFSAVRVNEQRGGFAARGFGLVNAQLSCPPHENHTCLSSNYNEDGRWSDWLQCDNGKIDGIQVHEQSGYGLINLRVHCAPFTAREQTERAEAADLLERQNELPTASLDPECQSQATVLCSDGLTAIPAELKIDFNTPTRAGFEPYQQYVKSCPCSCVNANARWAGNSQMEGQTVAVWNSKSKRWWNDECSCAMTHAERPRFEVLYYNDDTAYNSTAGTCNGIRGEDEPDSNYFRACFAHDLCLYENGHGKGPLGGFRWCAYFFWSGVRGIFTSR